MVTVLALAILSQASTLSYAESLYRQGEYFRAAGEYHRWLYENPAAPDRPKAMLGLGNAYLKGKRFADAERTLSQVPETSDWYPRARYSLARTYGGLGRVNEAERLFSELPASLREPADAQLSLLAARKGDWRRALGHVDAQPAIAIVVQHRLETPDRSPALAAALSLIPGGGQLYLGRQSDSLNAFLFTALTGLASGYYFSRDNTVLGATAATLSLSFWGGSIYGAAVEARRINQQTERDFLQRLTETVEAQSPE